VNERPVVVLDGWLMLYGSFMKNVYTVFDTGNSSVGFAKLSKNANSQK